MAPDRTDQHPLPGQLRLHRRCRRQRARQTLPPPLRRIGPPWGFAIYRSSHDDYEDSYEDSYLPTGYPVGTCEEALDTACGLYLGDPTAWLQPPTN